MGDSSDIVENRNIIEFHDIFDTKKEGLKQRTGHDIAQKIHI